MTRAVASTIPRSCAASDLGPGDLGAEAVRRGRAGGLAAVGIAGAEAFADVRAVLHQRRRAGLADAMQFTYRNPGRSTDPDRILPGARALVVGAWPYRRRDGSDGPEARPLRPRGQVARYARRDHYADLRAALVAVAGYLTGQGWRAVVVCDDNALVDRAAAHRAGLGWYGRNSLLLVPGLGSWCLLGSVVTDAPLVPTAPGGPAAPAAGCGACTRCLTACPTGALVAPGVLDARRCLAWLLQSPGTFPEEHRAALGGRLYGCDDCQTSCPVNRLADRRHPAPVPEPDSVAAVDLLALLGATDEDLLAAHGRWYVPARDPRYLRRNALVALGNLGDGDDPATEATLARVLAGDDPMLAEHAAWAARQLGRDDLVVAAPATGP